MFTDTHSHIHFAEVFTDLSEILQRAADAGVERIINVGVDPASSRDAMRLAKKKDGPVALYATAGLHPHEAAQGDPALDLIHDMAEDVVAIGECGLDYFKNHATKSEQDYALRAQLDIALEHNLPVVFHVRDAWQDFFTTLNDYPKIRGVIHSFTGHEAEVDRALSHNSKLYFGLNGIMTFTQEETQLQAARAIPAERMLLETDCPYLTPAPHRGKRNEPSYVPLIADFLARLRGVEIAELGRQTTENAETLFALSMAE